MDPKATELALAATTAAVVIAANGVAPKQDQSSEGVFQTPFVHKVALIVKMIVAIVSLAVGIRSVQFALNNLSQMNVLIQNWSLSPINDVKFVSFNEVCPAGYSQISYPSYPGSSPGCSCPSGSITVGSQCTSSNLAPPCSSVDAIRSTTLPLWSSAVSGGTEGVRICQRPFQSDSMAYQRRPRAVARNNAAGALTLGSCPSGWSICSAFSTSNATAPVPRESSDQFTCTFGPPGSACPVTNITVSKTPNPPSYYVDNILVSWKCTAVSGLFPPVYGCLAYCGVSPPLQNVQITDGQVCATSASSIRSSQDIRQGPIETCVTTDPLYIVIDTLTSVNEYISNRVPGLSGLENRSASAFFSWDRSLYHLQSRVGTNLFAHLASRQLKYRPMETTEVNWLSQCPVSRDSVFDDGLLLANLTTLMIAVLVLNSVIDLITDIGFGIYEFRSADTDERFSPKYRNIFRLKLTFEIVSIILKIVLGSVIVLWSAKIWGDFRSINSFKPSEHGLTLTGYGYGCTGSVALQSTIDQSFVTIQASMYSLLSANIFLLVWYVVGLLSMLFSLRSLGKRSGSNDDVVDPTRGLVGCNCYWWEFDTAQTSPPNSSPAKSVETIQAPGSPFRSNDSTTTRIDVLHRLSVSDRSAPLGVSTSATTHTGTVSVNKLQDKLKDTEAQVQGKRLLSE